MNTDRFNFRVFDTFRNKYSEIDFYMDQFGHLYYRSKTDKLISLTLGNRYIVEQCTGLKDKNGKLVYEGDVISRDGHRKEIRYYQGGFGWWTEYDDFVSFSGHRHLEEILKNHKIIGNIHETKQEQK